LDFYVYTIEEIEIKTVTTELTALISMSTS